MPADKYVNFYENVPEVEKRLVNTIILYDGEPYYVLCVADEKEDGVLRLYLDAINQKDGPSHRRHGNDIPYQFYDEGKKTKGMMMDQWIKNHPNEGVIRKMMNSPKFNRFRPFPLGMYNSHGGVIFVTRTPQRHTQQGLTYNMMEYHNHMIGIPGTQTKSCPGVSMWDHAFYDMVVGNYPTVTECIEQLTNPECQNSGAAFDRNFAFLRTPVTGSLFLAYKDDIVGIMSNPVEKCLYLSPDKYHLREAIDELNVFSDFKTY